MEGALGQRDKQKPGKGRQQTELGSEPGMGDGRVCKAAWETSKCKVTRTRSIKKKKKNTAQRRDGLQRALGPRGNSGQVSGRINCDE